jgi:hypothetical protein
MPHRLLHVVLVGRATTSCMRSIAASCLGSEALVHHASAQLSFGWQRLSATSPGPEAVGCLVVSWHQGRPRLAASGSEWHCPFGTRDAFPAGYSLYQVGFATPLRGVANPASG